jgi:hypothetical protein
VIQSIMTDPVTPPRNTPVFIALGLWALVFLWSGVNWYLSAPTGDGFTRGMNRITAFLGWQAVALGFGIVAYVFGRAQPKGSPMRWLSRVPVLIWLAEVMIVAAVILWAIVSHPA